MLTDPLCYGVDPCIRCNSFDHNRPIKNPKFILNYRLEDCHDIDECSSCFRYYFCLRMSIKEFTK